MRPQRLADAARLVTEVTRESYPDGSIPFHSRWRHFSVGGVDRWNDLAARLGAQTREERARARFDLVVTSVLLDAGAGGRWRWVEPGTGRAWHRSEGLALASIDLFSRGLLSSDPGVPRADAEGLENLDEGALAEAFQVRDDNPLVGLAGRAALLRRLGESLRAHPRLFGAARPRVGNLYDHLAGRAAQGRLQAAGVLEAVLVGFGAIWPGRLEIEGANLGDVWPHSALGEPGSAQALVPFHKLSQWLAYSLVEPLEEAGTRVTGLDRLTGLAEYRNGGLFLDTGVLELRDPAEADRVHDVGSELVVEWRALTVALLDRLAPLVREALGRPGLALASILEGGTWSAGRRIALARRSDGAPPIAVASDGTVF